jgi:hypothetical protein
MVEARRYLEAMEEFYSPEATAQENNDPPRVGLPALLENERKTLSRFGAAEAQCIRPIVIDGDQVVIHWVFTFPLPTGAKLKLDELALQTWRNDKLLKERFFYDSRQTRP